MFTEILDPSFVGPSVAGPTDWVPPVLTGSGGDGGMNLAADNPQPIDLPTVTPGGSNITSGLVGATAAQSTSPATTVGKVGKSINNLSGGSKVFLGAVIVAALLYLL